MVYLDNAATTYPKPESVYLAMDKANRTLAFNAGRGSYKAARDTAILINETKNALRKLVKADISAQVVFSPSITVALNQVINGINWVDGMTIYVSPYEHNAVARTVHSVAIKHQLNIKELPLNDVTLEVDIEKTKYEFSKNRPDAIFCTHVSNVTGYILPVKEVFALGKQYGSINVLDTAQSLGLIDLDVRTLPVDIVAFAGHKTLYGPFGIGGFINVSSVPIGLYLTGGTGSDSLNLDMPSEGEGKFEAASPNVIAISGLNAALDEVNIDSSFNHEKELTNYLYKKISSIPRIKTFVPADNSNHVGIISFVVEGVSSDTVGALLDEDYDIAVRTGYHCAPFIHKYLQDEKHLGTVRVGFSRYNQKEDIDKFIVAIKELCEELP